MFGQQPFRIAPTAPVQAMKTYEVSSPLATHTRPATCAEVECDGIRFGWESLIDERTELGQRQAHYIRKESGRTFSEVKTAGMPTRFTFPAGQRCFASDTHRVSLERPALYIVRGGDWRGNPAGERMTHARPEHWVEDSATHLDMLATRRQRG
jgi:hypothetical protein